MPETILLIDYENVKDTGLRQLPAHDRAQLFVGKGQRPKISFIEGALGQGTRLDLIQVAEQGRNNLDFYIAFYLGKLLQEEPNARFIVFSNDQDLDPLIAHLVKRGIPLTRMGTVLQARLARGASTPAPAKAAPIRSAPVRPAAARAPASRAAPAPRPAPARPAHVPARPVHARPAPVKQAPARPTLSRLADRKPHPDDVEDAIIFLKNAGKRQPKGRKALINSLADHLRMASTEVERIVDALLQSGFISILKDKVTYL